MPPTAAEGKRGRRFVKHMLSALHVSNVRTVSATWGARFSSLPYKEIPLALRGMQDSILFEEQVAQWKRFRPKSQRQSPLRIVVPIVSHSQRELCNTLSLVSINLATHYEEEHSMSRDEAPASVESATRAILLRPNLCRLQTLLVDLSEFSYNDVVSMIDLPIREGDLFIHNPTPSIILSRSTRRNR